MGLPFGGHCNDVRTVTLSPLVRVLSASRPRALPFTVGGSLTDFERAERIRALLDQHFELIWRSLRRFGVREGEVDDAAQEVFVVAAKRLDQILPDRERAFLVGTAVRVASTFRRSARRHPEEPSDVLDEQLGLDLNPEELSELRSARPVLQQILDSMSPEQRTVFVLSELEELGAPAIAEALTIPVGTVHSRLRGAREVFELATKRLLAKEAFLEAKR
jgi:RNA polymerase sigma-70 factor (ECF subfamily)